MFTSFVSAGWVLSVCVPSIVPGPLAWGQSVFGRCSSKLHLTQPSPPWPPHNPHCLSPGGVDTSWCTTTLSFSCCAYIPVVRFQPLSHMHNTSWIVYCPCRECISQWVTFDMTLHKDRITSHMTPLYRQTPSECFTLTTMHCKWEKDQQDEQQVQRLQFWNILITVSNALAKKEVCHAAL